MASTPSQDEVGRIIMLIRGLMEARGSYWCYLSVKPSRYQAFKAVVANKYNIQNFVNDGYGEVVVSGEGREPPKDVTEKVAGLFGLQVENLLAEHDDANPEATLGKLIDQTYAS